MNLITFLSYFALLMYFLLFQGHLEIVLLENQTKILIVSRFAVQQPKDHFEHLSYCIAATCQPTTVI